MIIRAHIKYIIFKFIFNFYSLYCFYLRMASNIAYETESVDDVSATGRALAPKRAPNETENHGSSHEATSLNVHLDTYFSDEKVPIPDRVSTRSTNLYKFD